MFTFPPLTDRVAVAPATEPAPVTGRLRWECR